MLDRLHQPLPAKSDYQTFLSGGKKEGGGGSILKLESAQLVVRSSRQQWRRTDLSVYTRDPAQASVSRVVVAK